MENHISHPFLRLSDTNRPYRDKLVEAATRVIDSGYYIGGPEVEALEKELADFCHVPHAVCVSNGLDAIRLILRAYIIMGRLAPGDEVIVPDMTFVATALAVNDSGLRMVPVDVDLRTGNLDSALVEKAITPRTRAIIPVHLYGRICCDKTLLDLVERHRLLMIEDAAQALGAENPHNGVADSRMAGGLGHAAAFSFYPTKNTGALGDAGAVTTHDAVLAETVRTLANYGYRGHYNSIYQGFNCRMDAIQAAMLRVKLPFAERENEYRRAQAREYDCLIDNPHIIKPLSPALPASHIYYQYSILLNTTSPQLTRSSQNSQISHNSQSIEAERRLRDAFREHMLAAGIETGVHYPFAIHSQPCFPDYNHLTFPAAETIAAAQVSLPIGPTTPLEAIPAIAQAINTFRP